MKPLTSVDDPSELVQTDFQSLPLVEVLQKSPNALLGVSNAAATALENIGAKTIFDLALSRVFDAATQLTDAAENASNALNRFGAPASDMLSAPLPPDTRVPDVRFMPPQILAGIPDANALIKFGTTQTSATASGSNKNKTTRRANSAPLSKTRTP